MTDTTLSAREAPRLRGRVLSVASLAAAALAVAALAGPRSGALLLIGLGFGIAMEGLRFGFTGPWRRMILFRDATGLVAQMVCIGLVAVAAFPLLAAHPTELIGADAPVGYAMVGGAFVFGACMQIVLGAGGGAHRIRRRMKRHTEGVTDYLEHEAIFGLHGSGQDLMVALAQILPGRALLLGEPRAAFDIRKQEGDCAGGDTATHRITLREVRNPVRMFARAR